MIYGGGGLEVEGWSKNEKELLDLENSVVIVGGRGIRGINHNRKQYNKKNKVEFD